ncbi:p-hydroxyphenylacetate 3-hydroxylase reductase component [Edwardsiella anguillarum]|uniref:p-hydroxyphenylacetate 3-hydroxylase reductase component n=1 Tax=Edwardsiella anguillarum TaxID=1821960 RepID=UPI0024B76418|nr:flavin reductase [Edwardsiella anguillarum]WHQ29593.1 flavin reductase [Edwardsiella anguillarum]
MMQTTGNGLDPRALRQALGNFATGVTVITTAGLDGVDVGMTANSFNSVSLDPPLILWSIDKRAGSYPHFAQASHFAVNILAADQIALSNRFARPAENKFAGLEYARGIADIPLLHDCAARFQCEKYQQIDAGDHWILIGKVVTIDDFGRAPLLYCQGAYSLVLPYPRPTKASPAPGAEPASLDNNVYYLLTQALRSYQSYYQPRQRACGLRTSEARMLLVLDTHREMSMEQLLCEVAMPLREIGEAEDALRRKGLVAPVGSNYCLTEEGKAQAAMLRDIADHQQQQVLAGFSVEDIALLKKILRAIPHACQTLSSVMK